MKFEEILIYFAGLFDGEGCVVIARQKNRSKGKSKYPCHYIQAQISNNNPEPLRLAWNLFGGTMFRRHRKECNQRTTWVWMVFTSGAEKFLKQILPYVIVKKEEIKLALEFRKEHKSNYIRLTDKVIVNRDMHQKELSNLKKREWLV